MSTTTNIGLVKPELAATSKIREDINANSDLIDAQFATTYLAPQAKNAVSITGGSITGITDLTIADGGTGSSTASDARTALGLAIGTNVQAYDDGLTAIAALAMTDSNMLVGNGTTWVLESGATLRTSIGLGSVENTALSTWAGTTNITTLGTIATGVWSGTVIGATKGGTGIANNAASTITITGAYTLGLTLSNTTAITLPTSGTLVNSAVATLSSLTSIGTITTGGLGTGAVIGGVTMTLGSDADFDTYYRASSVLTRLAPNTAASNKFLRMIGTGSAGQAPSWEALGTGDIPDISGTYQPVDASLTSISALTYVSGSYIALTAADTYGVRTYAQVLSDIGAANSGANSSITSLTGLTTPLGAAYGGTGIANAAGETITIGGGFGLTLTLSAATSITLPTSGTLATTGDLHTAATVTTTNGLSISGQEISLQLASTSAHGALSDTDWNTFNGKQAALTFGILDTNKVQISGSGVADDDYAKFTTTGLEGRSYSEVLSDIGAQATLTAGSVLATLLQNAAADLGAADVNIVLSNTNGAYVTNLTTDGTITATGFAGALTGNVTGNTSGSSGSCTGQAATVATITGLAPDTATTQATQPNITSLGTLTTLTVDNITINGNDISSIAGTDLTISPLAGQDVVIDEHWEFDGAALGCLTDNNTVITAYTGKNITIESVTFDGGVVGGISSLGVTGTRVTAGFFTDLTVTNNIGGSITGNAATVTTNANLTGIVTSTGNATAIANKAIAIAKLADGTDGELITWGADGVITTVPVGTATHVLTSNGVGAAPTFQAATGGATQLSDLSDVGVTTPTNLNALMADGDSWESRAISSADLSDVASIAMLDENETVTGIWSFPSIVVGDASFNVFIGEDVGISNVPSYGTYNVVVGESAFDSNTYGSYNTALGYDVLGCNTEGNSNVALGYDALYENITGSNNVAVGFAAGMYGADGEIEMTSPENSIYIGTDSKGKDNDDSNSIVIGYQAIGEGANTTVIGNSSTTATHLFGAVTAGSYLNKLSAFAATTSAELAGVMSDEIGAGKLRFDTSVTAKTTTATLNVNEAGTILCSAAGGAYTITLPTAVGNLGLTYHFIKTDANYTLITLDGNGTETINYENSTGAPVLTYARLNTYCAEVTVVSDGANWQVINERLGQVPECLVYLDGDQLNLVNGVWTIVTLNTESYDIGNNFNTSTYKFTVPIPGIYQTSAVITFKNIIADKTYGTQIKIPDAYEMNNVISMALVADFGCMSSFKLVPLAIGNTVQLNALSNSGGNTVDIWGQYELTWMQIRLISKT